MASLNMRYKGNVVQVPEGGVYDPQSYGTKRLNVKVNSIKTMRFGLTTNPNAKDYCPLQIRVGGQIGFIGRVSSTQYNSGDPVDYNGSVVGSRSTSLYTEEGIINTSSGSNTADVDPTIRTITNATGSSVTYATVSEEYQIATATWYSITQSCIIKQTSYQAGLYVGNGRQIARTTYPNNSVTKSINGLIWGSYPSFYSTTLYRSIKDSNINIINNYISEVSNKTQTINKSFNTILNIAWNSFSLTSMNLNITSTSYTNTTGTSSNSQVYNTIINNITSQATYSALSAARSLTLFGTVTLYGKNQGVPAKYPVFDGYYSTINVTENGKNQQIQTYYSYATSTRYSYSSSSGERITNSTTKVSETIHNINL